MARWLSGCIVCMLFTGFALFAQEGDQAKKMLAAGSVVPGPFETYNLTGFAKGRPHCLVCRFQQRPVVMAFTKEPTEGKDAPFLALVKEMEAAVNELQDHDLAAFVVVQSPDLRLFVGPDDGKKENDSARDAKVTDDFLQRMQKYTEPFKNSVLSAYSANDPPGYHLDKNAECTLVFYSRLKVIDVQTFPEGKLSDAEVKSFFEKVKKTLTANEKK